jgi:hypothetical protein
MSCFPGAIPSLLHQVGLTNINRLKQSNHYYLRRNEFRIFFGAISVSDRDHRSFHVDTNGDSFGY